MIGFIISVVNTFKAIFLALRPLKISITQEHKNTITQEHNNLLRNKRTINYRLSFETVLYKAQ